VIGGSFRRLGLSCTSGMFAHAWSVSRESVDASGSGTSDSVPRELGL
jgi:hypothetical protein